LDEVLHGNIYTIDPYVNQHVRIYLKAVSISLAQCLKRLFSGCNAKSVYKFKKRREKIPVQEYISQ